MDHVMYELNILLQMMVMLFLWHQIGDPKYSYFKILSAYYIPTVIAYIIFTFVINVPLGSDIHTAFRKYYPLLILFIMYHDKILKKIFMMVIFIIPALLIEKISIYVTLYIFNITLDDFVYVNNIHSFPMMIVADLMLITFIMISLIYKRKDFLFRKNVPYLLIIVVFVTIHFVSLIVYYSDNSVIENDNNNFIQFVYQSLLFILIFVQYFNMLRSQKLMEAEENLKHLESEMKHTYDYYMLADEKFSEVSKLRHDMQNQIQTVTYLIAGGKNTDEAQEIMEQMQQRLSASKTVHFCQNPIINSVMNVKLNEIIGSDVETDIVLKDCDNLPFDNYDICSLFANLFDNAFEACQRIGVSEERFIEMKSGIRGEYFILKVRNSCMDKQPKDKPLKSSKAEPNHGYGTKIIDNIAKKYDGSFQLEYQDGVMEAVVIMRFENQTSE